jgi:hypothetical protein
MPARPHHFDDHERRQKLLNQITRLQIEVQTSADPESRAELQRAREELRRLDDRALAGGRR